jgi:type I restriction enzyme S subunit
VSAAGKRSQPYPWEQRKLGDLGSVQMNKRIFKDQTSESGEVPFFKIGTFGKKPDSFISKKLFDEYKSKYPYPEVGDILISASGSIGRTVVYEGEDAYFQDSNIVWLEHDGRLKNSFLEQFLKRTKWNKIEGSTIKRLYNKDILNKKINLPKLKEQEKIGQLFQYLDKTITLHEEQHRQLERLKKALLQKMFADETGYPALRFKGFTEKWEQSYLKDIASVNSGRDYKHLNKGNIPVYGTGGYMLSVDKALSNTKDGIGIGRKGTINNPYILKAPFWTVDTLFYVIPYNVDLNFLYGIFQKIDWRKKDESTGVPSLSKENINKTKFKIPAISEQKEIGTIFQNLDTLITLHQHKIDNLKRLKCALLQKMFV